MKKIYSFNDIEFWEYTGHPDDAKEIMSIGIILENALVKPLYVKEFLDRGRIIILKDTKGYTIASTYFSKEDGLPQFLAGYRNEAIDDPKVLNAFSVFCKSMGIKLPDIRNACISYTGNNAEKMTRISGYLDSLG